MHRRMLDMTLKSICSFCDTISWWISIGFTVRRKDMSVIGSRIEETGTLIADGGGFALRRDIGGRWKLDLHRVPVDHVEKRVRISGIIVAEGLIDVDALRPDVPTV